MGNQQSYGLFTSAGRNPACTRRNVQTHKKQMMKITWVMTRVMIACPLYQQIFGKERGSVGTRTFLVFPSAKADFADKGVKL